ncbi:MAG: hypothetical protein WC514_02375 [Candidatus Paceibacterota bacterium]
MKLILKSSEVKDNVSNIMRKISYIFQGRSDDGEYNLVRPLGRDGYPRFHLYLKIDDEDFVFSLHLDQRKPSYSGATAHSGEYESEAVKNEAERIKKVLIN